LYNQLNETEKKNYRKIAYLPEEGGYVEWTGDSWTGVDPEQRIRGLESLNTQTTSTEGSVSQEGVIPGFTKLKNPDGAPGNYNEFMYEGPDGQIYGAGTYSSIAAGHVSKYI
jgi:hypothetical protein